MCKDVLTNEFVRNLIQENCVFWAGDIVHRPVYDTARALHVRQYPYLGLILPVSQDNYRVLHKVDGQEATQIDGLVAVLTQAAEDLAQNRQELANERNQAVQDRLLREEQDREYQEGLRKDREAEEQRKVEEEAQQRAREEEAQAQKQREQDAAEIEAKRRKLATDTIPSIQQQVEASADPKTKIQVKFPSGQRVNRTFLQTHTLKDLFDWVESCEYSETAGLKVPNKFSLSTSFPTKQLSRSETETLKDAGLCPNCQVLLTDLTDDDEP